MTSMNICPFLKIRPIWGLFKSEPYTGFFFRDREAIGARKMPGLGSGHMMGSAGSTENTSEKTALIFAFRQRFLVPDGVKQVAKTVWIL
ncbi:hypothetical protein [uncultured Methanoregula sp.]|uniref:hypothetical protein n=1 Tax=uncultured Methanoregula sp. TaxID=1005933 RepID=UPI002AAB9F30|nr:hypothetical protein [uncultured Methanoregula sp.]